MTCLYVKICEIHSNYSDHQHQLKLSNFQTHLVSTSNKRSSSGEMKIDLKRAGIYSGEGLDTFCDQR